MKALLALLLVFFNLPVFAQDLGKVFRILPNRSLEVMTSKPANLRFGQIIDFYRSGTIVGRGRVQKLFHSKIIALLVSGVPQVGDIVRPAKRATIPIVEPEIAFLPHVEVGDHYVCSVIRLQLTCWPTAHGSEFFPKLLPQSQRVAVSKHGFCSMGDGTVRCWAEDGYEDEIPVLRKARGLVAGLYHYCALEGGGVKCWGQNQYGQGVVPELRQVKKISAGALHTCALDVDGVTCWGLQSEELLEVPELRKPTNLWSGRGSNCAEDQTGIVCWGYGGAHNLLRIPALKNVKHISFGLTHACAVDSGGVVCWGDNRHDQLGVPELKNPTSVSAGEYISCALDDTGVICWGKNDRGGSGSAKDFFRQ